MDILVYAALVAIENGTSLALVAITLFAVFLAGIALIGVFSEPRRTDAGFRVETRRRSDV